MSAATLFAEETDRHASLVVAALVAVGLHVGLSAVVGRLPRHEVVAPPVVTELDLAPVPEPPPPPPEPKEEPKDDAPAPLVKTAAAAPPPPAARAGNVMTAKEDPQKPAPASDAPVDFVTDPGGTTYGGGVVARGGTADVGQRGGAAGGTGTRPVASAPAAPAPPAVLSGADLSRAPRLDEADACRGFYPRGADADSAVVSVALVIAPGGSVQSASVVSESPAGQGFGAAARQCLLGKRFSPGLDKEGKAVAAATSLRVRFSR